MAYFKDLSINKIDKNLSYTIINIGWIDNMHEFNKGKVTDEFLISLWEYIKVPINRTRGIYHNVLLDGKNKTFVVKYQGYNIILGSAEIRVIDTENKIIYASPNLILHYIVNHQYLPPQCFIEAVINGAKPNSIDYNKVLINKNSLHYKENLSCVFCGSHKLQLGYCFSNFKDKEHKIKVTEYSNSKNNIKISEEYKYDVICEECGRISKIPIRNILS